MGKVIVKSVVKRKPGHLKMARGGKRKKAKKKATKKRSSKKRRR